jgi:hypothetical protein
MEAWLNITDIVPAFQARVTGDGGTFEAYSCLLQSINF